MKYLLLMFLVSGCLNGGYKKSSSYAEACDTKIRSVLAKAANEIKMEFGFYHDGINMRGPEKVENLGLYFRTKRSLSMSEARELLLKSADCFLQTINNEKRIEKILIEYPFSSSRISVGIDIFPQQKKKDGDLTYASFSENNLSYYCLRGDKRLFLLKKETLKEALDASSEITLLDLKQIKM